MNKSRTISVVHNPGDPPIETDTDWEYVNSLTDEQIASAVADDLDAAPINYHKKTRVKFSPNAARIRGKLGMTQEAFAAAYGIPLGTLRDWEQGRKIPDATTRAYLRVIERDPKAIAKLLGTAA